MYKLQTALVQKGVHVKINQFQRYSEEARRMVTKYIVVDAFGETVCETYRPVDVVQVLAGILNAGGAGG